MVTGPNSELHEDIVGLTAAVHRFSRALLTGRWLNGSVNAHAIAHSSQTELESAVDVFRQYARSLRQHLHRRFLSLQSRGAETELAQLINALGYE
ncbi:unnamed protein product [Schistocephalus solidus]|uniref:Uncharacterized protein n=1 Tax=Schistocephalus solidus TaxID=70667 RepID=A0A3P7DJA9_SCHSO|nr:unnamed protein product [Schistocephalus solidus]